MINLKTRIREAYRAFVNPEEAIECRNFNKRIHDECLNSACIRGYPYQDGGEKVQGYTCMEFTQEEIQQSIAENQRKAGM